MKPKKEKHYYKLSVTFKQLRKLEKETELNLPLCRFSLQ